MVFARIKYTFEGRNFDFEVTTQFDSMVKLRSRLYWAKQHGVPVTIEYAV